MTSDGHPSIDELAELAEGVLAPEREAEVRAHLVGCAHCEEQASRVSQASDSLRGLGPVAMPAQVSARIDAALAAERRSAAVESVEPAGDVVPDLSGIRNRRRWRGYPSAPTAAAAAIVIFAVIAIVIGVNHHSPSKRLDNASTSTGADSLAPLVGVPPSSSSSTTFPIDTTGQSYSTGNLDKLAPRLLSGAATAPQAATGSTVQGSGSVNSGSGSTGTGDVPAPTSTAHTPKHPHSPLRAVTKGVPGALGAQSHSSAVPAALSRYSGNTVQARQNILSCAAFASSTPGAVPEAVDLGRWTDPTASRKNVPALIMIFAGPPGSDYNVVYVVGPDCGGGDIYKFENVTLSH